MRRNARESASRQKHQNAAAVIDDVEAGFPCGLTCPLVLGPRLHPNVFDAGGDRICDDLSGHGGRRDDRDGIRDTRQVGDLREGLVPLDLVLCRVERKDVVPGC